MKHTLLLVIVATLPLADVTHAATASAQKKDTVVIGTDKKTGGEAAGDRQRVQDIKDSIQRQREIAAQAKREREAQAKR